MKKRRIMNLNILVYIIVLYDMLSFSNISWLFQLCIVSSPNIG